MSKNDRSNLGRIGLTLGLLAMLAFGTTGCVAKIPLASADKDAARKQFGAPSEGTAGVYVYRISTVGTALKRELRINDTSLGKSAPKTYFYTEVSPGEHTLSTESEFGYNFLNFTANEGALYFFKQYIKMGVFVGGSNLESVSEATGKKDVLKCKLAQ